MTTRGLKGAAHRVGLCLIGFAVVAGALAGYLAYNHAFGAMINHFLHHAAEYSETRSVTLPPARIVLPAALASLLAMIVGLGLLRTAARFFEAYVIAVIAIGSIILLALDKAALINESAIAAVAYFPPLISRRLLLLQSGS